MNKDPVLLQVSFAPFALARKPREDHLRANLTFLKDYISQIHASDSAPLQAHNVIQVPPKR